MKLQNREVSTNFGTKGRVYYNFDPIEAVLPEKIFPTAEMIKIPASAKRNILQQLDIIGVNERKLFPDLSHQIKYTVDIVSQNLVEK